MATRLFRFIDTERIKGQLQWEPRAIWVGITWSPGSLKDLHWRTFHVYINIIPMLPLHFTLVLKTKLIRNQDDKSKQ